ncbi:MAG: serine/threonine-protein kinase [Myxococcales bacterium]
MMDTPGSKPEGAHLIGTVLQDRYRLTRLIGQGGMGAVFESVQLHLNKRVAVKLMSRDLAANAEALARFRREAEVTSQLGHPHIVHVFDFGEAPSGEPYLVMEYLEGEDLDHRLQRVGRLDLAATIRVVKQAASALTATHARGIIHRDLKPANIFLVDIEGEGDFVKIVDFGISKVRAAATKLTGASAVMGTPSYMSPEQATGQVDDIDHRTDEWALACITYEMLCGRPPFRGDSIQALLYQTIHQDPLPLAGRVPGLSRELDKVLGRALSKRQVDRFPTVTAFLRAFEAAASSGPPPLDSNLAEPAVLKKQSPRSEKPKAHAQVTTFSQTAAEVTNPMGRFNGRLSRPWAIAAIGGAALLIGVVATVRTTSTSSASRHGKATSTTPASADQATARPALRGHVAEPVLFPISSGDTTEHAADVVKSAPPPATAQKSPRTEVNAMLKATTAVPASAPVPRVGVDPTQQRRSSLRSTMPPGLPKRTKSHLIQDL